VSEIATDLALCPINEKPSAKPSDTPILPGARERMADDEEEIVHFIS